VVFSYNVNMLEALLRTMLFIPPLRPNLVPRPQLIEQLIQGLQLGHTLTLVSAPAGFGKNHVGKRMVSSCERRCPGSIGSRSYLLGLDPGAGN
jgi:LuxR family maltose regulon positive regulatory protein